MSLRRRLVAGFVIVAGVLVVTNVLLSRTIESYLLDRVDRQLADVASRPIFRGERGPGPGRPPGGDQTLSEYFIAVGNDDASSFRQLSSAFADENESPPRLQPRQVLGHVAGDGRRPQPFTASATEGDGSWRLIALEDPRGGGLSVVGISLSQVDDTVSRIRFIQIIGTFSVLAALGLVSWWMLRLGVHPIEDMARTADAIAGGDLSHRVEHPRKGTEAGRLGIALNSMLERIEEAFRAREASEARVRRFAADASHELRTPLTSIQGYAELWRAGALQTDADLAEAMRRIEQEAIRMGRLVDDLLLLARLDQKRPLDRARVRLDELAADAVRDARAIEPDRPIELASSPVAVVGDEMRLRQVIANLLANTRIHTPSDASVTVTVAAEDGKAMLVVADTGPGMDADVAAKVFERFYRADPSRARSAGGTGLGLSIVGAIAEAHRGQARVSSEPGNGARFVVELPLGAPELASAGAVDSELVEDPVDGRLPDDEAERRGSPTG